MKGVSALWDDVGLLSGEPEAGAQGLEADGALFFLVGGVVAGDDGEGGCDHGGVGVEGGRVGVGGVGGGLCGRGAGVGGAKGGGRRGAVGGALEDGTNGGCEGGGLVGRGRGAGREERRSMGNVCKEKERS